MMQDQAGDVSLVPAPTAATVVEMPEGGPWLGMWTQPRETVRALVATDPHRAVLLLAGLAGIAQVLENASSRNVGDTLPLFAIVASALLIGPFAGIIGVYISGALLAWTGRWIGGAAPPLHIRTAVAWAALPHVFALVLWVPTVALLGIEAFTAESTLLEDSLLVSLMMMFYWLTLAALAIWSFVLMLHGVGEVQGFSAWRALGNVLLSALVFAAAIVVPVLALMLVLPRP